MSLDIRLLKNRFKIFLLIAVGSIIGTYILLHGDQERLAFFATGETPFQPQAADVILYELKNGTIKCDANGRAILSGGSSQPYGSVYTTSDGRGISIVLLPSYRDHDTKSFGCYLHIREPFDTYNHVKKNVQAVGPARGSTGHETQILSLKLDRKVSNDSWYHAFGQW